ncbi:MAG: type 4a pilus biogenesis protein PilO [Acidimicrobiales bacterium]
MDQLRRFLWPIAIGGGTLIVLLIALSAWILPEGHKVSAANAQNTSLLSQETSLQDQIEGLQHESKSLPDNCSQLQQDQTLVPGSPTVDLFLHQISTLANNVGTQTPSVSIASSGAASGTSSGGAETVSIDLTVSGTYQQILNFLKGIDGKSLQRLYTVSNISVSGATTTSGSSQPVSTLTLQGAIYYTTGVQNVCSKTPTNPASSST